MLDSGRLTDLAKPRHLIDAQCAVPLEQPDDLNPPMIGQAGYHACPATISQSHTCTHIDLLQ